MSPGASPLMKRQTVTSMVRATTCGRPNPISTCRRRLDTRKSSPEATSTGGQRKEPKMPCSQPCVLATTLGTTQARVAGSTHPIPVSHSKWQTVSRNQVGMWHITTACTRPSIYSAHMELEAKFQTLLPDQCFSYRDSGSPRGPERSHRLGLIRSNSQSLIYVIRRKTLSHGVVDCPRLCIK